MKLLTTLLFLLASAQGDEKAKTNKGIISERMTSEQIAEAQKLI